MLSSESIEFYHFTIKLIFIIIYFKNGFVVIAATFYWGKLFHYKKSFLQIMKTYVLSRAPFHLFTVYSIMQKLWHFLYWRNWETFKEQVWQAL